MGMFDTIRVRIAAALSPKQMTRQISRPGKKDIDEWLMCQERLGYED